MGAEIKEAYVQSVSTYLVKNLVKAIGASGVPKGRADRLVARFDHQVKVQITHLLKGKLPNPWCEATCLNMCMGERINSNATMHVVGAYTADLHEALS